MKARIALLGIAAGMGLAVPGFTTDDAVKFAAIAARTYCPHQLEKK